MLAPLLYELLYQGLAIFFIIGALVVLVHLRLVLRPALVLIEVLYPLEVLQLVYLLLLFQILLQLLKLIVLRQLHLLELIQWPLFASFYALVLHIRQIFGV